MGFYIRDVYIDGKVLLAPMAGVTNQSYRKMCKSFNASYVVSEMISDKGIFYNDLKTKELAKVSPIEHPMAIQIFGGEIATLVNAARFVDNETDADIIDINMGCPVSKVLKSNAGSDYLKDPNRIYNTVKAVVEAVKKPVTVKIRIGYDHNSINVFEVVDRLIEAGCSAIVIHGRTKSDMYSNKVRYDLIKEVKEKHPSFPIIANGDITTYKQAKEILDYTKADAIMVGRATYGNPFILKQMHEYIENGIELEPMKLEEKIKILDEYAKDLIALKGEFIACKELRGQAGWFVKNLKNGAAIRNELAKINTYAELKNILQSIEL